MLVYVQYIFNVLKYVKLRDKEFGTGVAWDEPLLMKLNNYPLAQYAINNMIKHCLIKMKFQHLEKYSDYLIKFISFRLFEPTLQTYTQHAIERVESNTTLILVLAHLTTDSR